MKIKTINLSKSITHWVFFGISMALSVNMFIQFSNKLIIQLVFAILAAGLEYMKHLFILLLKDRIALVKDKKEKVSFSFLVQAITCFTLIMFSVIASVMFALSSIEQQSDYAIVENLEKNMYIAQYESIGSQIENINAQLNSLSTNKSTWVSSQASLRDEISELQTQQILIVSNINSIEKVETAASTVFDLFGETFNMTGKKIMFLMMLILVVLLEVCLILTTEGIEKDATENDNLKELLIFIDTLMDTPEGAKRLNSINTIMEKTGWEKNKVESYFDYLAKLKWNHMPLIVRHSNRTTANFNRDEIKKAVKIQNYSRYITQ